MNWESLNRNYRFIEILTVACFVFVSSAAEEKNQDYSPSGGEWERVSDTSYEHKGSIFSGFRYSTDNDATNTYNYEVGSPFSWSFVPSKTTFTNGVKIKEPTENYSGIKKINKAVNDPVSFVLSMGGELTRSGEKGDPVSWSASAATKFFYLTSSPAAIGTLLVPVGTSVTITANENASSKSCKWKINNTSLKGDPAEKSITLRKSTAVWWDPFTWFSYDYPVAGNYTVWASPTDSDISATKQIIYLDTYFSRGASIGYDDFTDWQKNSDSSNKVDAYFASPRKGQSGVVYVAIKNKTSTSSVNLNLTPSPIEEDIEISQTGTCVLIDTAVTKQSTGISLEATSVGETAIKAKLGSHSFPRSAVVHSFNEKKVKIGIITVNVPNGNSTISPSSSPSENFSPYTVCATTISVPSISYRCSITLDPTQSMPEISNGSVSWTHGQFSHSFGQLNPPSSMPTDVDVIVYVVPGIYQPEPEVAAFTSFNLQNNCDGIIVFTGSSLSTRPYVVAHELGHFFMGTGADVSPQEDPVNLMISGGSGDPAPNAGNTTELRYMQWKKINP